VLECALDAITSAAAIETLGEGFAVAFEFEESLFGGVGLGGEGIGAEKVDSSKEGPHSAFGEVLDVPRGEREAASGCGGIAALEEQIEGGFLGEGILFEALLCIEQGEPERRFAAEEERCDQVLEDL